MKKVLLALTCSLAAFFNSHSQCTITISGTDGCEFLDLGMFASITGDTLGTADVTWTVTGGASFSNPNGLSTTLIGTTAGTYTVTGTITGGSCSNEQTSYNAIVYPTPIITTTGDQIICAGDQVTISATATGGTAPYNYNIDAGGVLETPMSPSTTTTYMIDASDANGCLSAPEMVTITVDQLPLVNAGGDQIICADMPSVTMSGTSDAATVNWTTSGDGVFFPNATTLNADYGPGPNDIASGTATLSLVGVSPGGCTSTDQSILTITDAPAVSAGADITTCAGAGSVSLASTFTVATGMIWSTTGTGTFSPNDTDPNAIYIPSAQDETNGVVQLSATTTGNGSCMPAGDTLVIIFTPAPIANAGADQTSCGTGPIMLNGNPGDMPNWSTSGDGTFDNPNISNPTYMPGAADIAAGSVDLTYTIGQSPCVPSSDVITVTFTTGPTVNAGADQTLCGNDTIQLNGSVTNATGLTWKTPFGTIFQDVNSATTKAFPSPKNRFDGQIILIAESTGNGICNPAKDTVVITLTPKPHVFAGDDFTNLDPNVNLFGNVNGAAGGQWTTDGTGTFTDALSLNTQYTPSAQDRASGVVKFRLTTTGNGSCKPVSDEVFLTIVACDVNPEFSIVNGNQVQFNAKPANANAIGEFLWDYGDGNFGKGLTPTYTYSSTGNFTATLNFRTKDGQCTGSKTVNLNIAAATVSVHEISGTVKCGGSNLDEGAIAIFHKIDNKFEFVGTHLIQAADNGAYTLPFAVDGEYILHAFPKPGSACVNYIPTYYDADTTWEQAQILTVSGANIANADINLIQINVSNNTWNTGVDTIAGTVTIADTSSSNARSLDNGAEAAEGVIVYLYDENGELLSTTTTDEYGSYSFDGLEAGVYTIILEYVGTDITTEITYEVDGDADTKDSEDTDLLKTTEVTAIEGSINTQIIAYPNPASNNVTILGIDNFDYQIINNIGVNVQNGSSTDGNINISALSSGTYQIIVIGNDNIFLSKIVKQ